MSDLASTIISQKSTPGCSFCSEPGMVTILIDSIEQHPKYKPSSAHKSQSKKSILGMM
uniref:Uncharacterized protein n=1 Tax=Arundo donax TaxID=35708 RepID=A0A0A8YI58_ARUDO